MKVKGSSISGTNKEALLAEQKRLKAEGARTRLVKSGRMRWGKSWKQYYTLWWWRRRNPNLYKSFHGAEPMRVRKIKFDEPNPKEPLIKIGRLSQLNYIPEFPSKKSGTEFYHISGDTGEKTLKSNLILATDSKGKNLYLLKDKRSRYPVFSGRGILG